jgi:heme exporter protein D
MRRNIKKGKLKKKERQRRIRKAKMPQEKEYVGDRGGRG